MIEWKLNQFHVECLWKLIYRLTYRYPWGKSNMRRFLILLCWPQWRLFSGRPDCPPPAQAQESTAGLTVVAIDRQSISSNPANVHLAQSFLNLLFHLRERDTFTFVFIDDFDTT